MNELLLPFAKNKQSGDIVGPDEVPRGTKCGCVCLFCGEQVIARRGGTNRDHFAHAQRKEEPCPASFPRAVLWMASRVLREGRGFTTPNHNISLWHPFHKRAFVFDVAESKSIEYEPISFSEDAAGRAVFADLNVSGKSLGIIATFGGAPAELPQDWANDKACISLDLSFARPLYQREKKGFRYALAREMLSNPAHSVWVYHPRELVIRRRFSTDVASENVKTRLEVTEAEAARQEQMKREMEARSLEERARVDWLAAMMEELATLGHDVVDQCQKCYSSQEIGGTCCQRCKHHDLAQRPTNKGILEDIRYKFTCWGYGACSLRALPPKD